MKVKNLIQFGCLILIGILSTAFVRPTSVVEISNSEASEFAKFLSHFKKVELPYSMNLEDFKQYEQYKKGVKWKTLQKANKKSSKLKGAVGTSAISRSRYIPGTQGFSRMGGPNIHPVARFYPNEKMVAVVYSSKQDFVGELHKAYNLVVYNLKGDILFPNIKNTTSPYRFEFNLGSTSHRQTVTFRFDEQGNIWKNTYDNIWKHNFKKKPYKNNQLLDFQLKDTQVFQLNEKGVAEELKAIPSEARASLN